MKNPVGPVLAKGEEVDKILAALEDDNPDTQIEVIDRGAYLRVQAEDHLVLTQETLQIYLGSDYEIRSVELVMSSFAGRVSTTSDSITWQTGEHARAAAAKEGIGA